MGLPAGGDGDRFQAPRSAAAVLGDSCFLAVEPNPALLPAGGAGKPFQYLIPQTDGWAANVHLWSRCIKRITRHTTKRNAISIRFFHICFTSLRLKSRGVSEPPFYVTASLRPIWWIGLSMITAEVAACQVLPIETAFRDSAKNPPLTRGHQPCYSDHRKKAMTGTMPWNRPAERGRRWLKASLGLDSGQPPRSRP